MRFIGFVLPIDAYDQPARVEKSFIAITLSATKLRLSSEIHVAAVPVSGPLEWTCQPGWIGIGIFASEGDMLYRIVSDPPPVPGDQMIVTL